MKVIGVGNEAEPGISAGDQFERIFLSLRRFALSWLPSFLLGVAVLLAASSGRLQAQVASGSISGTITDATGAVIPGSTLIATSTATGAVRRTESDKDGAYSLPSLQPGTYRLSAKAKGFGAQISTVTVLLNQTLRADFKLEISSASQTVEVQTGVIELETDSHELSSTLGAEMVENLPSLNRDVFSTLDVAPGVAGYGSSNGNSDINFFQTGNNSLTIGGTTYGNTGYLQDGVTNYNLLTKTANLQPSPEDVQAVTIQMNGAAARFDNPATVNVVTRGGANKFHGRVYDYLRNDAFDAMGYYSKTKPKLRYNQFGASTEAFWQRAANAYGVPYHLDISMGWDPSPRSCQSDRYERADYPYEPILINNSPETFIKALTRAKAVLDSRPDQPRILSINAWNEWTEGSYLEPDVINGMKYLDAIRGVFGA